MNHVSAFDEVEQSAGSPIVSNRRLVIDNNLLMYVIRHKDGQTSVVFSTNEDNITGDEVVTRIRHQQMDVRNTPERKQSLAEALDILNKTLGLYTASC